MGLVENKPEKGTILEKETEYIDYIRTHVRNVQKAFEIFGEELCEKLGANYEAVQYNIEHHDDSKYEVEEFFPYRRKFYPASNETPNESEFDYAWLNHIHENKHHPEYWIIADSDNKPKVLDMSPECIVEMICDWQSFYYIGKGSAIEYYSKNRKEGLLSPKTRELLELALKVLE